VSTLYLGGRLHAPGFPGAGALLVRDGTIAWIGGTDEARELPADELVELDGALVTPAFVDGHVHLTETGLQLSGADLSGLRSVAALLDRVAAAARDGGPVLGHGWDETRLAEGRPPTVAELDRAAPGLVVYLSRVDVHSAVVSGPLADEAGLRELDGWHPDGRVERDAHHAAVGATRTAITPARRRRLQRTALHAAAAAGIAAVHEMSAPQLAPPEDLAELARLLAEEDLPAVAAYRGELVGDEAGARRLFAQAPLPLAGLGGDLCLDGSIGSRTAALRAGYADGPGRGHLYLSAEQVRQHVVACTRAGIPAAFHAIGDRAVDSVLAGFAEAAAVVGEAAVRAGRHRVEHLELIGPEGIAVAARLGLTASVQPVFDAAWGGRDGMYAARLGRDRAAAMNPFAALRAAGVPLVLGSDAPVTALGPWEAIRACVLHHVTGFRIGPVAAFEAHSATAWRALGQPAAGFLRPGADATFAIWDAGDLLVRAKGPDPAGPDEVRLPAGTALPDLRGGAAAPTCRATVRTGRMVYNQDAAGTTERDTPTTGTRPTRPGRQPS
jgi:predicted amidohydrolase YtcJ